MNTPKTAGEAAHTARWPTDSWKDKPDEIKDEWEKAAQAAIAFYKATNLPTPIDTERQKFEACASGWQIDLTRAQDGGYAYTPAIVAWAAWQAARKEGA